MGNLGESVVFLARTLGLSVIVPAYNEEATLTGILEKLEASLAAARIDYEIIIVDDGSRDQTFAVATQYSLRRPRVQVVSYPDNRGKGGAVKAGFPATRKEVVAYIDADIDVGPEALRTYFDGIAVEGHDVVIANKWDPRSGVDYSFARRFLSYAYGTLVKALFWIPIVDTQCGFKFFRRDALAASLPNVTINRFAFDVELLAHAVSNGFEINAKPIQIREIRPSRVNPLEMMKMFKDLGIIRIRMWQAPKVAVRELPRSIEARLAPDDRPEPMFETAVLRREP